MSPQLTIENEKVKVYEFLDTAGEVTDAGIPPRPRPRQRARGGCDWLAEVERQLQAIERLPPGWDSHGADRPNVDTIRNARRLIEKMASAERKLSKPHVNPTPSGGAQFDWEFGPRYFEIELIDRWTAQYYFVDHESHDEIEGELSAGDSIDHLVDYARRVGTEP